MNQVNKLDNVGKETQQTDKENYIVSMLIRTLYSNDVNNSECYRIIELFKEKVLGAVKY